MTGNKTNFVLLTVLLILAVFCHSGYMLKCYNCQGPTVGPCKSNITCAGSNDACLWLKSGQETISKCYQDSKCDMTNIGNEFKYNTFEYRCCQTDLCNRSPTTMISKAVFSIATMMTMIWILCF